MSADVDPAIARLAPELDVLSLDAGNTVVFFDHERVARLCREHGYAVRPDQVNRAEAQAKLAQEEGRLFRPVWSGAGNRAAASWAAYVSTVIHESGVPAEAVPSVLESAWTEHRRRNLWSLVPEGLVPALERVRAAGVRVVVVSNSEGELEAFLASVGVLAAVDAVVDSGIVGVEKPDPAIFRFALHRFGVPPERALHLGDIYATDVLGARAAGLHVALVDPFGHLEGRHLDVPRVRGASAVADMMVAARGKSKEPSSGLGR